ncbi:hypothetical protein GCM10010531_25100 [Blastococcus jejuensis]|uniref:Uncharacterized protein n=1 Tax=Blastococcus jejuensis TaxID=351224 RepID=A0ABP6P854_9ACTN
MHLRQPVGRDRRRDTQQEQCGVHPREEREATRDQEQRAGQDGRRARGRGAGWAAAVDGGHLRRRG